jgi:hypothetical protein
MFAPQKPPANDRNLPKASELAEGNASRSERELHPLGFGADATGDQVAGLTQIFAQSRNKIPIGGILHAQPTYWVKSDGGMWSTLVDPGAHAPEDLVQVGKLLEFAVRAQDGIQDQSTPGILDVWPERVPCKTDGQQAPKSYTYAAGWSKDTKARDVLRAISESFPQEHILGTSCTKQFGHSALRIRVAPLRYCEFLACIKRLGLQSKTITEVPTSSYHVKITATKAGTALAVMLAARKLIEGLKSKHPGLVVELINQRRAPHPPGKDEEALPPAFEASIKVPQLLTEDNGGVEVTTTTTTVLTVRGNGCVGRSASKACKLALAELATEQSVTAQLVPENPLIPQPPPPPRPEDKEDTERKEMIADAIMNAVKRFGPLRLSEAVIGAFSKLAARYRVEAQYVHDWVGELHKLRNPFTLVELLTRCAAGADGVRSLEAQTPKEDLMQQLADDPDLHLLATNRGAEPPALQTWADRTRRAASEYFKAKPAGKGRKSTSHPSQPPPPPASRNVAAGRASRRAAMKNERKRAKRRH